MIYMVAHSNPGRAPGAGTVLGWCAPYRTSKAALGRRQISFKKVVPSRREVCMWTVNDEVYHDGARNYATSDASLLQAARALGPTTACVWKAPP